VSMKRADLALALSQAIGTDDQDFLTIGNAWASITITRDTGSGTTYFEVSGDAHQRGFPLLVDALMYALAELREFERGRVR
jgi:hypothetical protein